jgi:hypothetical protein
VEKPFCNGGVAIAKRPEGAASISRHQQQASAASSTAAATTAAASAAAACNVMWCHDDNMYVLQRSNHLHTNSTKLNCELVARNCELDARIAMHLTMLRLRLQLQKMVEQLS